MGLDNKDLKESFTKLNKALSGNSIEEFTNFVDDVLFHMNIMTKKMDKKKEKYVVING